MKLVQLLEGLEHQTELHDIDVENVTGDSRQVEKGSLFICMKGQKFDGHNHAAQALQNGAVAVVVEKDMGLPQQIIVPDSHYAYPIICSNFFGRPSEKLKIIGVTGTNGKTTTTYLLKHILEFAGKTVGLMGTIQNEIVDMAIPSKHTTPDPLTFHTMLARMVEAGCQYVVMEVSSHALDQKRVAGCRFAAGVFTNLTQDHLDYHGTMEGYYLAKRKLFEMCDLAVVNFDDSYGRRLLEECHCQKASFSLESDVADYTAKDIKISAAGSAFALLGKGLIQRIKILQPGRFSVANAMGAIVCCLSMGIDLPLIVDALKDCPGVVGRFEVLPTETEYTVIRDYAHTPDGIEKILDAVSEIKTTRVITLFGCAGERDRKKRADMGRKAAAKSDFVVITSDNPRSEDPRQIIDDAIPGIEECKTDYIAIPDRYDAIEWVLSHAQPGDIVLLLGKGHEDYQVLDYGTIYFDEKVVIRDVLAGKPKAPKQHYEKK